MDETQDQREQDYPSNAPEASGSILDTLRDMRRRALEANPRRTAVEVPGYEGKVAVVYGWPEGGIDAVAKSVAHEKGAKTASDRVDGAADLLIASCVTLAGKTADGSLVDVVTGDPFDMKAGELPVNTFRFGRSLGEALGMQIPSEAKSVARLVCRQLFSPRGPSTGVWDGDLALTQTSDAIYAWLVGLEDARDEVTQGE